MEIQREVENLSLSRYKILEVLKISIKNDLKQDKNYDEAVQGCAQPKNKHRDTEIMKTFVQYLAILLTTFLQNYKFSDQWTMKNGLT